MSKAEFLAGLRDARAELERVLGRYDERTLGEKVTPGLAWTARTRSPTSSGTT